MAQNKKNTNKRDQRRVRTQQVIFGVIAIIIILAWVMSLVINL